MRQPTGQFEVEGVVEVPRDVLLLRRVVRLESDLGTVVRPQFLNVFALLLLRRMPGPPLLAKVGTLTLKLEGSSEWLWMDVYFAKFEWLIR